MRDVIGNRVQILNSNARNACANEGRGRVTRPTAAINRRAVYGTDPSRRSSRTGYCATATGRGSKAGRAPRWFLGSTMVLEARDGRRRRAARCHLHERRNCDAATSRATSRHLAISLSRQIRAARIRVLVDQLLGGRASCNARAQNATRDSSQPPRLGPDSSRATSYRNSASSSPTT
jgi:hypothetical protein